MKKLLSIALTMGILVGMVCVFPASAAKYKTSADGMYKYEVVDKVYARLVECYAPTGEGTVLEIPSEVDGYKVKYIGTIYKNQININDDSPETIIIPEGVTHIEDFAFCYEDDRSCGGSTDDNDKTSLVKIILPSTIEHIGMYAFAGCYKLKNINIPKNLKYIGEGAFRYCEKIEKLKLPDGLLYIGGVAFDSNRNLEKLIIPGTVQYIGKELISGSGIEILKIEEGVIEIPEEFCKTAGSLRKVVLPKSLKSIGKKAFIRCPKLKKITICENVDIKLEDKSLGYYQYRYNNSDLVELRPLKSFKIKTKETTLKNLSCDPVEYANYNNMKSVYILKPNAKKKLTSEIGTVTRLKIDGKKVVKWKSSNTKVAKITANGKFKAIAKGTATITATLKDGTTYTRKVKVLNY